MGGGAPRVSQRHALRLQVDFYLRLLADGEDEKKRSQVSRNRRLAAMNRCGRCAESSAHSGPSCAAKLLVGLRAGSPCGGPTLHLSAFSSRLLKEGTYFSEKEMRDRQPGTYHQVGQAPPVLPCTACIRVFARPAAVSMSVERWQPAAYMPGIQAL